MSIINKISKFLDNKSKYGLCDDCQTILLSHISMHILEDNISGEETTVCHSCFTYNDYSDFNEIE